jgi:hypothetical protein
MIGFNQIVQGFSADQLGILTEQGKILKLDVIVAGLMAKERQIVRWKVTSNSKECSLS